MIPVRIVFEVPGDPVAKARPRVNRATGAVYTPRGTVVFERLVGTIARQYFKAPLQGPVTVEIKSVIAPPVSWTKKKTAALLWRPHTQKPDADNLQKAVLDALNGIAFKDDSQVWSAKTSKIWGAPAKTLVIVEGSE